MPSPKMKTYKNNFKEYLKDLADSVPHPGGGSCAWLSICLGISLIQKSLIFSKLDSKRVSYLEKVKKEALSFIDRDGQIFANLIKEKNPQKKRILLCRAQKISYEAGKKCNKILSRVESLKGRIKKSIESDFYIGVKLIEVALYASIENLKANQTLFKVNNTKKIEFLKAYLTRFEKCLRY